MELLKKLLVYYGLGVSASLLIIGFIHLYSLVVETCFWYAEWSVGGGSAAAATAAGMEATVPENCTAANFCRSYLSLINARTSRSVDAVVGRFQGGGGKFAS